MKHLRSIDEIGPDAVRRLLDLAAEAGVETAEARAHEKVRRRSWSV